MTHFTTVFLSSTARDLQPWRDAVAEAIGKMSGFHCVRMEDFGAVDAEPVEVCRRKVADSDVFVGLVGHLYGSRPDGSDLSYTQLEYEEAKRSGKPRLLFVADEDFPLPARLGREPEEDFERQRAFRDQVRYERTVAFFREPQELATLVVVALQAQQEGRHAPQGNEGGVRVEVWGSPATAVRDINVQVKAVAVPATSQDPFKTRRRRQFCRVLDSDLATLAKVESWNDQYFTDLEAEVEAEGEYYVSPPRRWFRRPSRGLRRVRSLIEAIETSAEPAILLVGEPGSGKSVALRHVAHQLAERGARSSRRETPIPLYLNLKELRISSGPVSADTIKQFVLDNIRRGDADTAAYVRENWDDFRDRGIWFFLFDSFDEIPAVLHAPIGSRIIQEHAEAIRQFLAGMSTCRGVLASREFKGPSFLPWQKFRILPLSVERQERLAANFFLDPPQRLLVHRYLAESESSLLGSNPLFLSLLCRYVRREGRLPASHYDLLVDHVRHLAERDSDYVQRTYALSAEDLLAGAERLAVLFAEASDLSLAPTFEEIFAALGLGKESHGDLQNLLAALVDVKIGRSDVREARAGDRRFTFSHRRYQEALFAAYLANHPGHISSRELLTDPRWREYTVVLLQTSDADTVSPLVDEAILLLREAADRQRREPVLAEFNSELTYFLWEDEPLPYLLALLEEGLARRRPAHWHRLSMEAARILESRWNEGDLYDRLRVLEVGGLLPDEALEEHIGYAVKLGASRLQAAAFRKVEALREIPRHLTEWVRERLSDGLLAAQDRSEQRRLEALAARLPAAVGADAVVDRCSLLRALTTPLWLLAFPAAALNLPFVFVLGLAIAASMLAQGRMVFRIVSLAAAIYALAAPRLPHLVDPRAVTNRLQIPGVVLAGLLLWLLVIVVLYTLRSAGPLWNRYTLRQLVPSARDLKLFLLFLAFFSGPGLLLGGILSAFHRHYSMSDLVLYSSTAMGYAALLGLGGMVWWNFRKAASHRASLRQAGMSEALILLEQARAGLLGTHDPLREMDEATLRSLSRLVLDISSPAGKRSAAALERLLVSVDRRLGVLQLLRGVTEWSSSISPFDLLDQLSSQRRSSQQS
jgi:hypothetical protein